MRLTELDDVAPPPRDRIRPLPSGVHLTPADVRTLYELHATQCFTLAFRLLASDRIAAEEVVRDVFVRAWQSVDVFTEGQGSIEAWLVYATRLACLDRLRRRTSGPPEVPKRTLPEALIPSSEPSHGLPHLTAGRVRAALNSLPVQQRVAIELASFEGLTCNLIAERTGVSVRTVEEHLRSGLRAVRDAFG